MDIMINDLIFLILGLIVLTAGAEFLVRGGARMAFLCGITPLAIGLTIVAYGTSAPELVVSINAALKNQADISLGNVIGSNVFNVLFILGACAVIKPLIVHRNLVRIDVPVMILVSVLLYILAVDGVISRFDGVIFCAGLVGYTWFTLHSSRGTTQGTDLSFLGDPDRYRSAEHRPKLIVINLFWVVAGLVLLVLGSNLLVDSAVSVARRMGVSDLVIGLTLVAVGTSMPEVATSIVATIRNQRDIAIGNVVGSSIYNILAILGISSLLPPEGIKVSAQIIRLDLPVMIGVAIVCYPIFLTAYRVRRWEGALLLGYYAAYTAYLVIINAYPHHASMFERIMHYVLPLSMVVLMVSFVHGVSVRTRKTRN